MKNVAVTGFSGFVGKQLMARNDSASHFLPLDLRRALDAIGPDQNGIDHLIHLAAKTFVPDSWKTPAEFYDANVMGTQRALDYCVRHKCGMTYVSSYVYGVPVRLPIDETHPVSPNTPYNHSKLMGEELCEFYHNYYGVNVAIVRPFNIYGPSQDSSFLIPTIIRQLMGETEIKLQNLEPRRDYLYIDDFLDALIATIGFAGFERFNLGSGYSVSVKELTELVFRVSGKTKQVTVSGQKRDNEVMDVVADANKFRDRFNWSPVTDLETGIKKILSGSKQS